MFSHVLLWVFGKTRKSEPKTWKIPMPRVSGRNPLTRRKSLRSVANQLFSQQFIDYPCRSTKWWWNKHPLWQLWEDKLQCPLLLWLCSIHVFRMSVRTWNYARCIRGTQSDACQRLPRSRLRSFVKATALLHQEVPRARNHEILLPSVSILSLPSLHRHGS